MKLSIWRQFSSNHSNNFTIVGQFKSTKVATEASKDLTVIFDDLEEQSKAGIDALKLYFQQFGIDWSETKAPDWITEFLLDIEQYENLLYVNHSQNYSPFEAVELLMTLLGANTGIMGEWQQDFITWTFEFEIMNANKADEFEQMLLDLSLFDYKAYHDKYPDFPNVIFTHPPDSEYKTMEYRRDKTSFHLREIETGTLSYDIPVILEWLTQCGASNVTYHIDVESKQ